MTSVLAEQLRSATTPGQGRQLTCCTVGAVSNTGSGDFVHPYGTRSLADQEPLQDDAVYLLASCTKLVTAIAVLQCVEHGQLPLDDAEQLRTILHGFATPNLLEIDGDLGPETKYSVVSFRGYFTLRQLLSHTSGVGYDAFPPLVFWKMATKQEIQMTSGYMDAYRTPLIFEPGTSYKYGAGYDWAGLLVARVNNVKLGEYMEENIFKPLGITDMTFDIDKRPDLQAKLVTPSSRAKDGSISDGGPVLPTGRDHLGGGGLYASAPALLKILKAILTKDARILKPESFDLMMTNQIATEKGLAQINRDYSMPRTIPLALPGLDAGASWNWGFGGAIVQDGIQGKLNPGSFCWAGATTCFWTIDPSKGYGYVYMASATPFGDPEMEGLRSAVREELYKKLNA